MALSAPWGAGKTSVAKMMQGLLKRWVADRDGERTRIACWFNAWEHDDAPHLGAALAANVARTANKRRRIWLRLLQPLPATMLGPRERWRRLVLMVLVTGVIAGALVAFNATRDLAASTLSLDEAVVGGLGWLGVLWLAMLTWRAVFSVAGDAAKFIDDPRSEAAKGSIAQVRDQLGTLIRQATRGGRMVIFVDDLERCQPARAVEVFEVASQLLGHPGVVTVLLADMRSLSAAAKAAYEGGIDSTDTDLGRRYLEKLVQLELELPPPTVEDMQRLLAGEPNHKGPKKEQSARPVTPFSWEDVQSWAFTGALFGIFWLVFSSVFSEPSLSNESALSLTLEAFGQIAPLAAFGGSLVGLAVSLWRWWERRRRQQIVEHLESNIEEVSVEADDAEEEILMQNVAGSERLESFADKEAESLLTVHSSEIRQVEEFIQLYPPLFPRGAKRMLNHARLLTKIARDRQMFGGNPELTPQHLGKWIVLKERWPEFVAGVVAKRSSIEEEAELRAAGIDALGCEARDLDRELSRLVDEAPGLAVVLDRLVYFKPSSDPTPEDPRLTRSEARR